MQEGDKIKTIAKACGKIVNLLPIETQAYFYKQFLPRLLNLPLISQAYRKLYFMSIRGKAWDIEWTTLILEPLNACNLSCKMCPLKYSKRNVEQMNVLLSEQIMHDAKENGIKHVCFSYYNEPLLDSFLSHRIRCAKELGLETSIITNGQLLTAKKARELVASGLDAISISIDASRPSTYRKLRGANLRKVVKNILYLLKIKKDMIVHVEFLSQKENQGEFREFKTFWKGKADKIVYGYADDMVHKGIVPRKYSTCGLKPFPCFSNFMDFVVVRSDGKVAKCCGWFDEDTTFADLTFQSFGDIRKSDAYKRILKKMLEGKGDEIQGCKECSGLYRSASYLWWMK